MAGMFLPGGRCVLGLGPSMRVGRLWALCLSGLSCSVGEVRCSLCPAFVSCFRAFLGTGVPRGTIWSLCCAAGPEYMGLGLFACFPVGWRGSLSVWAVGAFGLHVPRGTIQHSAGPAALVALV